jgi:hypothetical protein
MRKSPAALERVFVTCRVVSELIAVSNQPYYLSRKKKDGLFKSRCYTLHIVEQLRAYVISKCILCDFTNVSGLDVNLLLVQIL